MKRLLLAAVGASGLLGQTAGLLPAVPTTKVLALGHLTQDFTPAKAREIMTSEVRDTVRLYLSGKLDQWYSRQDERGVVFVLNVASVKEASDLLEQLPLGKAHMMKFDLIPLGPLAPLQILLRETPQP